MTIEPELAEPVEEELDEDETGGIFPPIQHKREPNDVVAVPAIEQQTEELEDLAETTEQEGSALEDPPKDETVAEKAKQGGKKEQKKGTAEEEPPQETGVTLMASLGIFGLVAAAAGGGGYYYYKRRK
eukprot:GHVQ01012650.1.p1 GENE.GHVQ01012650.1~~GHVQ01012650.1.p1  ORF type:complete len:128 (-),score=40.94 GHVQ01012650.1:670-1053(-)